MRYLLASGLALVLLVDVNTAEAVGMTRRARARGAWSAPYAHPAWGTPAALIVPPTADYETVYSTRVAGTRMRPITPQFGPGGPGIGVTGAQPAPYWPQNTRQMGVYYLRGPW
jgi:hypothetical protein